MWVVKIGGSLNHDPLLLQWLELFGQLGGGRVALVCGGGSFADEVRREQARLHFNDLAAHNMALLAMCQVGHLLNALNPSLQLAHSDEDVRRILRTGHTALWVPTDQLRTQADGGTNWDHSSDSIALALALRLQAQRLLVLKSCDVNRSWTLDQLGDHGITDRAFATLAKDARFPIEVLSRDALPHVRELLLA